MTRLHPGYILAALASFALVAMPVLQLRTMHTAVADMGVYTNYFWVLGHHQWERLGFGHVTPLLMAYFPLWQLHSSPEILLLQQSATLLVGGYVFVKLGRELKLPGWLCPLAYLAYFPIWYNALFDFHPDHMGIPIGLAFYLFVQKRQWKRALLAGMLLCLVKEVYAFSAFFMGVYLLLKGRKIGYGFSLAAWSAAYALLAYFVVIPALAYANANYTIGVSARLGSLMADGWAALAGVVFSPGKWLYLMLLFGALAFVPLLAPLELLPLLPLLAGTFVLADPNYHGYGHHYTAAFVAPLLAAFAHGVFRIQSLHRSNYALYLAGVVLVSANILISPSPISRLFVTGKVWRYGYEAYVPTKRDAMIERAIADYVPDDEDVVVSSQNTLFTPGLGLRRVLFAFPSGTRQAELFPDFSVESGHGLYTADYVLIDLKRPWYLLASGCGWRTGLEYSLDQDTWKSLGLQFSPGQLPWAGCLAEAERNEFIECLKAVQAQYDLLFSHDGFMIFGAPQ